MAHPVFVNTARKGEAAIKVLMFPRRIRGCAGMMGVQLGRYLDGLDWGIPSFPAAASGRERAAFLRGPVREERHSTGVCVCLPSSSFLSSVLFFVLLCVRA